MPDCHWCNKDRDDGEHLEECRFFVCRDCIRHMGQYKDEVSWQFFLAEEVAESVERPEDLRKDLSDAIRDVFEEHGLDPDSVSDEWEVNAPGNPIVHCSDGPRLILANGKVVRPRVTFDHWDKMLFLHRDQGASVYGPEVDDPRVSIAFVDDPTGREVEAVTDRLEQYGFETED